MAKRTTCSVAVCDRPAAGPVGLCEPHRLWLRRKGTMPTHALRQSARMRKPCSVPVCDRLVHARGLCGEHYLWSRKNGGAIPVHAVGAKRRGRTPGTCSVLSCDRPRMCDEYCGAHWAWAKLHPGEEVPDYVVGRSWRSGGAAAALARHSGPPDPVTGCIIWTGSLNKDGYGNVARCHGADRAHRLAWLVRYGSLPPKGMELDHVRARGCTSRACINVDHLEPVTHAENVRRAFG